MVKEQKTVFLSYCTKDSDIADLIDSNLNARLENTIKISRYTRDVEYRASFKEFMNTVSEHDFVLCIVSDSYLKSFPCLYEVGETLRNRDFESRLLFLVLGEDSRKYYKNKENLVAANIYSFEGRINYIKHWENILNERREKVFSIGRENAQISGRMEMAQISKIIDYDLPEFMDCLADRRGISFDECVATYFDAIVTAIDPCAKPIIGNCANMHNLLEKSIKMISEATKTDYNQIILRSKIDAYELGLVVFADRISPHKQKYRITAIDGLISKTFDKGVTHNIKDTRYAKDYFPAVCQTQSELIIPIKISGQTVGVINSESEETDYYTPELVNQITYISREIAIQLNRLGYHSRMSFTDIPYVSL